MYQRSDGKMTGNPQQGRHFDRMSGAGGVQARGSGGGKSKEGAAPGPQDVAEGAHETQPHPETGVHEVHIKHHGDGSYSTHVFHEPIGPHPQAHMATVTHHQSSQDAHDHAQTHFPNDGDETGMDDGQTLSGITGGMPGQNDEGPSKRRF